MKTFDVTFSDKKTKETIIIIRANANGVEKAKKVATKNFTHTHRDIDLNTVDISIKQIVDGEEDYL